MAAASPPESSLAPRPSPLAPRLSQRATLRALYTRSFELALGLLEQDRSEARSSEGSSERQAEAEAEAGGDELAPVLYVAGSGALEWLVREYEARLPGSIVYLGQVAHTQARPALAPHVHVYAHALGTRSLAPGAA